MITHEAMRDESKIQKFSAAEAWVRILRYCAYQERSHVEVRKKLFGYGLYSDEADAILTRLILEGFLNEERFAKAFAGGKFRMKKWGRNKIVHALKAQGLTGNCIQRGLGEIDEPDYRKALEEVIKKKSTRTTDENPFVKRDKVARFAIAKGYEPDLVWEVVKRLMPD
jgi:regulatory protein